MYSWHISTFLKLYLILGSHGIMLGKYECNYISAVGKIFKYKVVISQYSVLDFWIKYRKLISYCQSICKKAFTFYTNLLWSLGQIQSPRSAYVKYHRMNKGNILNIKTSHFEHLVFVYIFSFVFQYFPMKVFYF